MAHGEAKQPIISAICDPNQAKQSKHGQRRNRHNKNAPTELNLPEKNRGMRITKSMAFIFYLSVGTLCFFFFKNHIKGKKTNGTLDAIYFCIVTMTTVGYGDLVANSVPTKLLACTFVFTGMAVAALILGKAADYLVGKQEVLMVKALHFNQVDQIDVLKEVKTKNVRYKLLMTVALLLVLMIVGTIFLSHVEEFDFVDSFYCVCCTITTLGYGDKSFSTVAGRIFAVFWIPTSTICLAQFFLYLAELKTEHRQKSLVNWVLNRRFTHTDIELADRDGNGVVSEAEFIVYKLKEMGKISQEEIALIMDQFKDLDIDRNGTLSPSDILG